MSHALMRTRRLSRATAALALTLGGIGLLAVGSASGTTPPTPKATGGIEMTGPLQYESFSAFASTPAKGSVTYSNFELAAPGSGVWNWNNNSSSTYAPIHISFFLLGLYWNHTMTITSIDATSPNSLTFTATGTYDPDPTDYTWTATGSIVGTTVTINIVYTGVDAGATYSLVGTISPDGSISGGTATGQFFSGTFSLPPGTLYEIFAFTAPVTCASVNQAASSATFGFTIPAGTPSYLTGLPVIVRVVDGGSPGAVYDLYSHAVDSGQGACDPNVVTTPYTIIGGNLVVH